MTFKKLIRDLKCEDCDGKGGTRVKSCADCKGQGMKVKMVQVRRSIEDSLIIVW